MPVKPNQNAKTHDPILTPPPLVPLPLPCKYGGLGDVIEPLNQGLLIGDGKRFVCLESPKEDGHFLQSNKDGVAWSEFTLALLGHAKIDQSLHKAGSPIFSSLGIHAESGGTSWFRRKNSKDDYTINLDANCNIDQNISKKSNVVFESVSATHINVDLVKLTKTEINAAKAGAGTIAMTKDGACLSNGIEWLSLHGNIHGNGTVNCLSFFNKETGLASAESLKYVDGLFGINVGKIMARFHVGEEVQFDSGAILGNLSEKSRDYCFGLVDGRAGYKHPNGFMVFGSGHGNLKGKGSKGRLAFFSEEETLGSINAAITEEGALYTDNILCQGLRTKKIILEQMVLSATEKSLYMNETEVSPAFKRGKFECNFGETEGNGRLVEGDLIIKATLASTTKHGIARFDDKYFTVNDGIVGFDLKKMPRATKESNGFLYEADYNYFAAKAPAFNTGKVCEGLGISVKGNGQVFGESIRIDAKIGDYENAGILQPMERDFIVKNGMIELRYQPPSTGQIQEVFAAKQDKIDLSHLTCGLGFKQDYRFDVVGGKDLTIELAVASNENQGIARFIDSDFIVKNGTVYAKSIPMANGKTHGLMAMEYVQLLSQLSEGFAKCPQGSGDEGTLAMWTANGDLETATDFVKTNLGLNYKKLFEASNFRTPGVLILGTTEAKAEQIGGGALRFEKGCLEVSNGQQWVTLRAGGLTGTGKQGSLAYWNDENSLSAPQELFWDETQNSLGMGTDKPLANIHIERAGASIIISDTRPSSPQSGAALLLAANDGADLGASDCLGKIVFGGKNAIGASIRAYAAANWDKISTPTSLAFGTTPDGQISPVEHLFITTGGFIGVDIASPLAPLHIHAQNKNGMAGIFDGGIKIGSSDASASIVGKGAMKFESGRLLVSDGYAWRTLTMEA